MEDIGWADFCTQPRDRHSMYVNRRGQPAALNHSLARLHSVRMEEWAMMRCEGILWGGRKPVKNTHWYALVKERACLSDPCLHVMVCYEKNTRIFHVWVNFSTLKYTHRAGKNCIFLSYICVFTHLHPNKMGYCRIFLSIRCVKPHPGTRWLC